MKRRFILLCLSGLACSLSSLADVSKGQQRIIIVDREVNIPVEQVNRVVDQFVYELQTDINHLFSWAFVGTENQNDTKGRDAISILYNGATYNPKTRSGVLDVTICVLGVPWFRHREIGSIYHDSILNGTRFARLNLTYSGSMLQAANGQFHTKAIGKGNAASVHFVLDVVLGKFFSSFVTNKIWKDCVVWRIEMMVDNILEYATTGKVTRKKTTNYQ